MEIDLTQVEQLLSAGRGEEARVVLEEALQSYRPDGEESAAALVEAAELGLRVDSRVAAGYEQALDEAIAAMQQLPEIEQEITEGIEKKGLQQQISQM